MMSDEEIKKLVARFYELLNATKAPKITNYDLNGMILFDKDDSDIRKLFAVDAKFDELLNTSALLLEIDGREVNLFLGPGEENPLTVYIAPKAGEANGESMTLNIPSQGKLDAKALKEYLHQYLTDKAFKTGIIQGNENFLFISKA